MFYQSVRFSLFIFLLIMNHHLVSQNDTITNSPDELVEIYDVVAIYKQVTDGRGRTRSFVSELKGEILNYDESTGVLTFKDRSGKMYSFNSNQYKYFEYDKEFRKKVKKVVLHERKENEFEFSLGLRASFINLNDNFNGDNHFISSGGGSTDLPIALTISAGKYVERKHYIGAIGEIPLVSYGNKYFSAGIRYAYQYDAYKKNVAFYVPIELGYLRSNYDQTFQTNDTTVTVYPGGGTSMIYPSNESLNYDISAISLSLGQGFGFILRNKHSFSLELSLIKYFPTNTRFIEANQLPDVNFTGSGIRFSLAYNI